MGHCSTSNFNESRQSHLRIANVTALAHYWPPVDNISIVAERQNILYPAAASS